jgi:tetratricopeptide (TPR) repeat protein
MRSIEYNAGAIVDYNKAIELNPDNSLAYNNRGAAKSNLGDKQGAIVDYDKAIELNPNYADAYYDRGLAYQKLRENQRALADFREAARLYQQQGNTTWYQKANDRIRELGG